MPLFRWPTGPYCTSSQEGRTGSVGVSFLRTELLMLRNKSAKLRNFRSFDECGNAFSHFSPELRFSQ